jgi:hypothetical protein
VRKATSLQNRANDIRQQHQQQAFSHRNRNTKRGDVLDLQELEAVLLEHMEMLQAISEPLREQQFQAILELGVELQDILREIKKLHNAYPPPCETNLATPVKSVANTPDCILDTPRMQQRLKRQIRLSTTPPVKLSTHGKTFHTL